MNRMFLIAVLLLSVVLNFAPAEGAGLEPRPLQINDYGLHDLGVVDANNDGFLDIFTSNHSGEQSLLLNNGSGGFREAYSDWNMDQDIRFPGLAVYPREPEPDKPGIYINWVGPDVVVRLHALEKQTPVKGSIEVFTSVHIMSQQDVAVEVASTKVNPELDSSTVTFTGQGSGFFVFRPFNHALPFNFKFNTAVAPGSVFVGRKKASPPSLDFNFQLRDRHGMAWADFNNDEKIDVFITRGGERNTMSKMPIPFWDELLVGGNGCLEDIGAAAGLAKKGCPGRQAAWVDFDGDNLLDIYVVCGRGDNPHPNMLFKQTPEGKFVDVAAQVGLDIDRNGIFVWLDADRDGRMDLFWVDVSGVFLYRNRNNTFEPTRIETRQPLSGRVKLSVADFDNDGDLDLFLTAYPHNRLFVNNGGHFTEVEPQSLGLPQKCSTANWVDFNNDGLLDLHTLPQGLYLQTEPGRFSLQPRTGVKIARYTPFQMVGARASWFDMDNDGSRDAVWSTEWAQKKSRLWNLYSRIFDKAKRFGGLDAFWETSLLRNAGNDNHWLQVELTGPAGNRPAIGAFITLETASGVQGQQVGVAEGSHFSQGHYRLYFGLGAEKEISSLRIDWPDGATSRVVVPGVDRLLKISHPEGTPSS